MNSAKNIIVVNGKKNHNNAPKKKKNTPICLHCTKLWPICTTVSVHGNQPLWQIPEDCDSYLWGASKRGTYGKKLAWDHIYLSFSKMVVFFVTKKENKKGKVISSDWSVHEIKWINNAWPNRTKRMKVTEVCDWI